MGKKKLIVLLAAGMLLSVTSVAHAQFRDYLDENFPDVVEGMEGGVLGVGVYINTEPYYGVDNDVNAVPVAIIDYKGFFVDGGVFGYTINDGEEFEFSVIGKPRLGVGYEEDDSEALRGMEDRDGSFDAGGRFEWLHEEFTLTLDGVGDLSDTHNGAEIEATLSKELFQGFLTPRVGFKWLSESFVDYYYGVRGNEGTANRPPYEGDSTINFVGGLTVAVPLGKEWAAFGDFEYHALTSDITDSPIVEDDEILTYIAGIVYRF